MVERYFKAIREQDAVEKLNYDPNAEGDIDSNEKIPDVVLEEDIILKMIELESRPLTLKLLAGKLCVLLFLGSKRRPSCLTRSQRQSVVWTATELRAEVVAPKEASKSKKKTRSLVCERLSDHPAADVVSVYKNYVERTKSLTGSTILTQCRLQKGKPAVPSPATVKFWTRAYLEHLGYAADLKLTPYVLIKSVTTARLATAQSAEEEQRIAQNRWDNVNTMLRHYNLNGKTFRVVRPAGVNL